MDIVTYALCKKLIEEKGPFTPKGEWSETSAYSAAEVVSYNGSSYVAKKSVPAGTALTNTDYWLVIANKGDKGDTGDTGETGAQGVSVESAEVNASGHLIVTLDDGTTIDAGFVKGDAGNPEGNILQTLGQSEEDTVSQKCVTDALDEKADIDGYYDELTAGNAEQLIATVGNVDNAPYLYRTSGGSADIGNRVNENYIEGGTVVRNQLVENGNFESTDGWVAQDCTLSVSDNIATATATGSICQVMQNFTLINGHVYLFGVTVKASNNTMQLRISNSYGGGDVFASKSTNKQRLLSIWSSTINGTLSYPQIYANDIAPGESFDIENVVLFDLTQMFGSAIADHLASLPIADALVKLKPWIDTNKYYAYDAGSFESVNLAKKISTGFNQWDEEWESGIWDIYSAQEGTGEKQSLSGYIRCANKIPVIPNSTYYFKRSATINDSYIGFYDANGDYLHANQYSGAGFNGLFTIPDSCHYITFYANITTYNHDICVNLSWSGSRNGEYKAYETHEYAMPSGELRGIPKLDANNRIVYDGDRYYPDGKNEKRYHVTILDDLSASLVTGTIWIVHLEGKKLITDNMRSEHYIVGNAFSEVGTYTQDGNDDSVYINTGSSVNKPSGKMVYELATPTTSEGTPYQQTQIVDDWGTEEFVPVSGNEMPVGHNSFYGANLRDKLQHLPNLANADGTYAVQQVGSQMTLVPIAQVIPAPPASGTHVLKAVNGTLTWIEEA